MSGGTAVVGAARNEPATLQEFTETVEGNAAFLVLDWG
jgi:hypothetical protein